MKQSWLFCDSCRLCEQGLIWWWRGSWPWVSLTTGSAPDSLASGWESQWVTCTIFQQYTNARPLLQDPHQAACQRLQGMWPLSGGYHWSWLAKIENSFVKHKLDPCWSVLAWCGEAQPAWLDKVQERAAQLSKDNYGSNDPSLHTLQHWQDVAETTIKYKTNVCYVSHL